MAKTIVHWKKELARIWTNYLPPCRPSCSELVICTKYLRKIQSVTRNRQLNLLILGSTSEFRDWGHEENLNVTVIDYSEEYHQQIKWELRYKYIQEMFVNQRWQDMFFENEFDIILGDLVVGNLKENELPRFLINVEKALVKDGFFITKSFFRKNDYTPKSLEEIFAEYKRSESKFHPFPSLIYDIAISCMNIKTGILSFNYMNNKIYKLYKSGVINKGLWEKFNCLGWEKNMKFGFFIPIITQWETMVNKYLQIYSKDYGQDIYSNNFPVYVITTKKARS
ncbi:MAG: hypothetical protein V1709_10845 [Planctomycetota bacterium]